MRSRVGPSRSPIMVNTCRSGTVRKTKVALQELAQPGEILHNHRLIQPKGHFSDAQFLLQSCGGSARSISSGLPGAMEEMIYARMVMPKNVGIAISTRFQDVFASS